MNQHQIKIMNYPEPPAEELLVKKATQAYTLARRWSEAAISSGLEGLLIRSDRPALEELIGNARTRQLLSPEVREEIEYLAGSCARRIAELTDPDAPATRSKALVLHDSSERLYWLMGVVDEVLDLEQALRTRHQIMART